MKRSILVTGAHRSGSTWIGKIITKAEGVRYVSEPFNLLGHKKYTPFNYWFYYIDEDTADLEQQVAKSYINSFYNYSLKSIYRDFIKVRSFKAFKQITQDYVNRSSYRTLLKDPIALFSAEWLAENYRCDVVISVRHPAAFIASLKVKNWQFNFNNFLNQKDLMHKHLSEYKNEITAFAKDRPDIIEQGILLWNIIYSTVLSYQLKHGDKWYFFTHEALSLNPVEEFNKIFDYLKLDFSDAVKNELMASTTADESSNLKRNAKENIFSWKKRLTTEEIERIKLKTTPLWSQFYDESSWG